MTSKDRIYRTIGFGLLITCVLVYIGRFVFFMNQEEIDFSEFKYPLEVNLKPIIETLRRNQKAVTDPINEYNYKFTISNKWKCKSDKIGFEKVHLLIMIKTSLSNIERRNVIRNSWGIEDYYPNIVIRRLFFLGMSPKPHEMKLINDEYEEYKDIIQSNFLDSYYNLSIKTMMSFKWVIQYCPLAQFIFSVDDDMYVSTTNLLQYLSNVSELRNLSETISPHNPNSFKILPIEEGSFLVGHVHDKIQPIRNRLHKWYMPMKEYPYNQYPPFIPGGSILMSYETLLDLHYVSLYTQHFRLEDIYIGILAKRLNISIVHNEYLYWKREFNKTDYKNVIATHLFKNNIDLRYTIWKEQRSLGYA